MVAGERLTFEDYKRRKSLGNDKFSDEEIRIAKKYLKNPTNAGIWLLEAQWLFDSSISNEIKAAITKSAPNLKVNRRRISVSENDISSLLDRTETISFYLRLFTRLVCLKDETETLTEYIEENEEDHIIISLLDLDEFAIRYKNALSHFTKCVYKSDTTFKVGKSHMTRINGGTFTCNVGPNSLMDSQIYKKSHEFRYRPRYGVKTKIELISLSYDPLKNIAIFFDKLKLINKPVQYAVFSPEEHVLSPYVDILSKTISYLSPRDSDIQFFVKMISDYQDRNYTGCISTAGLIAEDCLTQIYETIYRSPVPRKMMLGPLRQKISEAARNRDIKEIDHQGVVRLLDEYKTNNKTDPIRLADINSKLLLRYIDEKYKKIDTRVDNIEGEMKNDEFFPSIVKMNLEDIIRFRNAVSHKSLDPVGSFEALKSIYCSFSLVVWWDEEKKKIDWNQNQKDIVKQFVALAKDYTN